MLSAQPGMYSGMADMAKEMSKLKGVPVSQIMRMGTTADRSPLPAASEAFLPASNSPNAGASPNQASTNAANSAATSNAENQAGSHIGSFGGVPSSIGNLGGFGGFHKKKPQQQPDQTTANGAAPSGAPQNAAVLMNHGDDEFLLRSR